MVATKALIILDFHVNRDVRNLPKLRNTNFSL